VIRAAAELAADPNPLAPDYSAFRVGERILLSGHSHQAWPDAARTGQLEAFEDAATEVDEKWPRAFAKAERFRRAVGLWLDEPGAQVAFATNTHDLILRFLSALDLARRPRLVSTDGEFHSLRRQLARFAEAGLEVVREPAEPVATLAARLAARTDARTAAVMVSAVLFESAKIVPGLAELARACERTGAELLVDAYHALGCLPYPLAAQGLSSAWVVGAGYKYLEIGEGNGYLRLPPQAERLRPVVTGWYAEFATLAQEHDPDRVAYGAGGARYAGATYDPTSHYRAARVFDYFERRGLTPDLLRASYRRQVARLAERFDALDLPPDSIDRDRATPLDRIGGFLTLHAPRAGEICAALKAAGVSCDSRGRRLRLGPAPYLSDAQIDEGIRRLGAVVRDLEDDRSSEARRR
jgi:kynureninase